MKRIIMAGELLVTDDRLADVVLAYARALALHNTADTVTFPVLGEHGDIEEASMLLGPASQIILTDADREEVELPVDAALEDLRRRLQRLTGPTTPVAEESPGDDSPFLSFDDYLP